MATRRRTPKPKTNAGRRERRGEEMNAALANMVIHGKPGAVTMKQQEDSDVVPSKALAMSLIDFSTVLTLVFGGCCSNVWAYEYLLKIDSQLGTALTFSQMLFVTVQTLPSFLVWRSTVFSLPLPQLKPRQVPLSQWLLQVIVLTAGSLLNNWAFAFHVPLTVQIIFRSAGLAVSMLFGRFLMNKRYSALQMVAVLCVSIGVVLATLSRPSLPSQDSPEDFAEYSMGIIMLVLSLFLTGVLGMLQEKTYTRYGPCWREGVFYTHALSLPIFLLFVPDIKHGFHSLSASTYRPTPTSTSGLSSTSVLHLLSTYSPYLVLAGNLVSQLVCVTGVNQLTSHVSSVSTNLVLTTRKAISLCFSVWWFGNGWNAQLGVGAGMVFLGSLLYTLASSSTASVAKSKKSS